MVPTPIGPADVFVTSLFPDIHFGEFSGLLTEAKTSSRGRLMTMLSSSVAMASSCLSARLTRVLVWVLSCRTRFAAALHSHPWQSTTRATDLACYAAHAASRPAIAGPAPGPPVRGIPD